MQQFLFVLHLPENTLVDDDSRDGKNIYWSNLETKIKASGLPTAVSCKPPGTSRRIARNLWLIPTEESAQSLAAIQQLSTYFQIEYSAFTIPGDVASMKK